MRDEIGSGTHGIKSVSYTHRLRETFRDDEHIRFHPIITEGGQAVNAIPEEVKIESYVRGASLEAIDQANRRINRAIAASVAAMGATVTLQDRPGYCPMHDDEAMNEVALAAMKRIVSDDEILIQTHWGTGCTDMGDLSAVDVYKRQKWGLQSLMEIPILLVGDKLMKKYDPANLMLGASVLFGVRFVVYSLIQNPWWMIAAAVFQMVTFPIIIISSQLMLDAIIPEKLKSSGQMAAMRVYMSL